MKRYLFELCAYLGEAGVERRSRWISDEWLRTELARDSNLDRVVELPSEFVIDGVSHTLPDNKTTLDGPEAS